MSKKTFIAAAAASAAAAAAAMRLNEKRRAYFSDNKKKIWDFSDALVQKIVGKMADGVSDNGIPFINRYDNSGFMEGSGYFLLAPAKDAFWSAGFAKNSVVPENINGDCYIGGYLAFPANKMNGIINEQMVRALAVSDNSGRGINVFAVVDCLGLSNTDIRAVRQRLKKLISEKNIVSVNISATHCHSGIDTVGLWGDILKAYRNNKKAVREGRQGDTISGKNPEFMENLISVCAETIEQAVNGMEKGRLFCARIPAESFVRDKRPPYVTDDIISVLKFLPSGGGAPLSALFMAAHPTCYGDKQREAVCDFPRYICDALEKSGVQAMFFQGAQAAVATDRGRHVPQGLCHNDGIRAYGEAVAAHIAAVPDSEYKELAPLLNVALSELFLPSDNKILQLAGKLKLVNNQLTRIAMTDSPEPEADERELYFATEIGFAQFGGVMNFAMVPGELMPEIAVGGAFPDWASYNGESWNYPPLCEILGGDTSVIGLCNDFIGYIVPDNDFGSMFAPLHYEEAVSAGRRTASNIAAGFIRLKEKTEKATI